MNTSAAFVAAVASAVSVTAVVAEPVAADGAGEPAAIGSVGSAAGVGSVGSAAGPICTAGAAHGETWVTATVSSECGLRVQARICRYYGGIICYNGPQAYKSHVSSTTGVSAGYYFRYEETRDNWSNWVNIG